MENDSGKENTDIQHGHKPKAEAEALKIVIHHSDDINKEEGLPGRPAFRDQLGLTERYYQETFGWTLSDKQLKAATMSDQEEAPPPPSHCKVLLAGTLSKKLQAEVKAGVEKLRKPPTLVGFLSSSDPAARVYAEWTGKTAEDHGLNFELREVDREELEGALLHANTDPKIDGIIVYYPIFNNRQDQYLQQVVDMSKDVEGLSHKYLFNMYQNVRYLDANHSIKSVLPCTPLAVIKILEYLQIYNTILPFGNRLHGHTITVINRSEVVGRPLAALLANDGARVYSVDVIDVQEFSRGEGIRKKRHDVTEKPGWKLKDCLPLSDVVISGVPGEKFKVPVDLIRDGAVCINFSSEKNFPVEVKEKASIYIPAIGKMTIMVLLRNLLRVIHNRQEFDRKEAERHRQSIPNASVPDAATKLAYSERRKLSIAFPPPDSSGLTGQSSEPLK